MKRLILISIFALFAASISFAQDLTPNPGSDSPGRESVERIKPNMKYKHYKSFYDYKDYTPTLSDRYSPAWSGVASFFIPGLGQMVCGEVGRGFAWLGGTVGCWAAAGLGNIFAYFGDEEGEIVRTVAMAGAIALHVFAIGDGIRVAKVKNMYEQDLKKMYSLDIDLYPSVNYVKTGQGLQPTAGLTLAMRF